MHVNGFISIFSLIFLHSFFAICLDVFLAESEISLAIKFREGKAIG